MDRVSATNKDTVFHDLEDRLGNALQAGDETQVEGVQKAVTASLVAIKAIQNSSPSPSRRSNSLMSEESVACLDAALSDLSVALPTSAPGSPVMDHDAIAAREAKALAAVRALMGAAISPTAASAKYSFPPPKISGADDESACRRVVTNFLKGQTSELVPWSDDGLPFLDILTSHGSTLDVVLLDIHMKSLHGDAVLKKMQDNPEHPEWNEITVGICSTDTDYTKLEDGVPKWQKLGADFFVQKPFDKSQLLFSMQEAFERLSKSEANKRWIRKSPTTK